MSPSIKIFVLKVVILYKSLEELKLFAN